MADNGIFSTNLPRAVIADSLLVNVGETTRSQPVNDLATQIISSGPVADRINGLVVDADSITRQTWAQLSAIAGTRLGQRGYVEADAGTHTDPVVGGTKDNQGIYAWSVAPAGWQWMSKDDVAELENTINGLPLPGNMYHPKHAGVLVTDDQDRVHLAYNHDGTLEPLESPSNKRFVCRVVGVAPYREILIQRDDGVTCTIAGGSIEGDAFSPAIAGTKCRYMINRGGDIEVQWQELDPTATLGSSVAALYQYVLNGQSLELGAYSGPTTSTMAAYPGRVLMFKAAGIRALDLSHHPVYQNRRQDVSLLDHLADAVERTHADYGDTGWARFGQALFSGPNSLNSQTDAVLISAHGIGGRGYASLKKGTVPYANMLVAIRRGFNIAKLLGLTYKLIGGGFVGGEADCDVLAITAPVYAGYMNEYQADFQADVRAILGNTDDVRIFIDQLASWTVLTGGTGGKPAVSVGQLAAAVSNPLIVNVGSKYVTEPSPDGIHILARGYRRRGEMFAKAARPAIAGVTQQPFRATGAVRSGLTITVATAGGTGNLVIDTVQSPARVNRGFALVQVGGTPTAIADVAVSGTNVIIALTVDPGPAAVLTLRIGAAGTMGAKPMTANAPGTNIRDSGAEPSLDGDPQQLWLSIDDNFPVTGA